VILEREVKEWDFEQTNGSFITEQEDETFCGAGLEEREMKGKMRIMQKNRDIKLSEVN
jgi:hypothetical protein